MSEVEVHLHVRTCMPRFPDLANGWMDRVQFLCVNRDPLEGNLLRSLTGVRIAAKTSHNMLSREIYRMGSVATP